MELSVIDFFFNCPSIEYDSVGYCLDVLDARFIQGWAGVFYVCNFGVGSIHDLAVFARRKLGLGRCLMAELQ